MSQRASKARFIFGVDRRCAIALSTFVRGEAADDGSPGVDNVYNSYQAFELGVALKMLDAGFKQGDPEQSACRWEYPCSKSPEQSSAHGR